MVGKKDCFFGVVGNLCALLFLSVEHVENAGWFYSNSLFIVTSWQLYSYILHHCRHKTWLPGRALQSKAHCDKILTELVPKTLFHPLLYPHSAHMHAAMSAFLYIPQTRYLPMHSPLVWKKGYMNVGQCLRL